MRQVDLMIQSFERHAGSAPYNAPLDLYDASWMSYRRYKDYGTEQMFLAYTNAWGDCLRENKIDALADVEPEVYEDISSAVYVPEPFGQAASDACDGKGGSKPCGQIECPKCEGIPF